MNRKETTEFLSELLIRKRLLGMGKYYAREVTLDYGHGKGKEKRVDFMQYEPQNQLTVSGLEKGIFICYEVKSCKADFKSGNGLNFEGDKNYLVMTMDTYKAIIAEEQNGKKLIPWHVGVLTPCPCTVRAVDEFMNPHSIEDKDICWDLKPVKNAHLADRQRSMTELLFCMLRAGR